MFEKTKALLMTAVILLSMPKIVFAAGGSAQIQSVTAVTVPGNYKYITDAYDEQSQLMPVSNSRFGRSYGYADKDGNIKIPIHEEWVSAGSFTNNRAIVHNNNTKKVSVIDTSGTVIFNLEENIPLYSSGGNFLQVLENDPNGMYCVYADGIGDTYKQPKNPTLSIYDKQGNRIKKDLPYDSIARFNNGVAILYKLTSSRETTIFVGGGSTTQYSYSPAGTIDTKGVISDVVPSEEILDEAKTQTDKNFGFTVNYSDNKQNITIKNIAGNEIYKCNSSEWDWNKYHIINEYALLIPIKKEDGTTALTLMDSNGNLYSQYAFSSWEFGGVYGNRFIARPYKTLAEKFAYADTLGSEGANWKKSTTYLADGKDTPVGNLQPPTIYEIQKAPNFIKVGSVERLWGDNRYKTAVEISKSGWQKSDNVILVDGNNYPDALVGTCFAYLKNSPVLTTPSDKLDSDISAEIERLGAKTIYILGNETSISKDVEKELSQKYSVVRIYGSDVFDTAVKVGEEIRKTNKFDTVALSSQGGFADALAIAPFSARNTMPILFSGKDSLRSDTRKVLQDWGIKNVVIVGGTGVISSNVETELGALGIKATRLAGQDRYDTSLQILKHFAPTEGYKNISIATGEAYPDALTGAVLAAKNNTPLVLVSKNNVADNIAEYLNMNTIDKAYIFGGIGVVSDKVVGK